MESTENKVMGVLSYISVLVLIPIFIGQKNDFVRQHTNQGLNLCIIGIACRICAFFTIIPLLGKLIGLIIGLVSFVTFILSVIGIIYAVQGKNISFPIIGDIKLLP